MIPKHLSGRVTRCYWGWISNTGPGDLVEIERRLNAVQYLRILENTLLPGINARFPDNEPVYVIEDNSPVHTALVVRNWYEAQLPRIVRLNHPPRSPDLNPIENVWSKMVSKWRADRAINNVDRLRLKVNNIWGELRNQPQYFDNLVTSMPRRLQKVIDADGWHIHY